MNRADCDLQSCFLCRHCIPEWKELIGIKKKTFTLKKGKKIFEEGEPVKGMFFLNAGRAKVLKNWGSEKELIIRFSKPGDTLGHRGFGGNSVYPVSAIALEDVKVCFIDNELLATLLQTNTGFTYELMKIYATELQHAEKKMRDLVHMDVKGRIAVALLEMQEVFGTNGEGFISLAISRQDIASFAGTTYETIFKSFNELLAQQMLTISGKYIKINDRKRLQKSIGLQNGHE